MEGDVPRSRKVDQNVIDEELQPLCRYLCILNSILSVSGLVILIVGVWSNVKYLPFKPYEVSSVHQDYTALLLMSGSLLLLLGVVGCWGAMHLQHYMLCGFAYTVAFASLLEMLGGALALSYMYHTNLNIDETFLYLLREKYIDPYEDYFSKTLYQLHIDHKCCGAVSYRDWIGSRWWQHQRNISSIAVIPDFCCREPLLDRFCNTGYAPYTDVVQPTIVLNLGCVKAIGETKQYIFFVSGIVAEIMGVLQLIGFYATHFIVIKIFEHENRVPKG